MAKKQMQIKSPKTEDHLGIQSGKYTMERPFLIYDDEDGSKIEFGPDKDGLDCYEILQYENVGGVEKVINRIFLNEDQIALLKLAFEEVVGKHPIVRSYDRD